MLSFTKFTNRVLRNKATSTFPLAATGFQSSLFGYSRFLFSSIDNLRNIGISAHIDSGKTTFTERILFYGGKINAIHEVKGTDNVGAKMDFMELEREKGITIQSAATTVHWKNKQINVIDTPGHVDFTIEVERALRVLDGAVLILCGASGVQPQTLTVDKQMKRYNVPRIIFINKLDRMGANPWAAIEGARRRLHLNCAAVQTPIGLDHNLKGIIDLLKMKAYYFEGKSGEQIKEEEIPANLLEEAQAKRQELIDCLANVDATIEDLYLSEKPISAQDLKDAIRRQTLALKFVPVFMGSAYRNKGVQLALDGVQDYLPCPKERTYQGFLQQNGEEIQVPLDVDPRKPFIGLAFKLEENKFGQLTYVRVYQGKLKKGDYIYINNLKKRAKVSRMVKMHANEMEEIDQVEAGDIFALFGIECSSGDTITEGDMKTEIMLSSMFVPAPVLSLSIKTKKTDASGKFLKALAKFQREDPTFHVNQDKESEETIISGMGELHLQIYAERLKREFNLDVELGEPTVNYRETIASNTGFDYLHKKQSGGAGQYGRVIGTLESIPLDDNAEYKNQFVNKIIGTSIPNEYIPAIEKAFYDCCEKGPLTGYPVVNVRYTLTDGATHPVDSSSMAFMWATKFSFKQAFTNAMPVLLEPIMNLEITCPQENYSSVMAGITKRRGMITYTEGRGDIFILQAHAPLSEMFGYATELRGLTSGQGSYSMEYRNHEAIPPQNMQPIVDKFQAKMKKREAEGK